MTIDLVQLRTFVAVAEEQHLTRAAERIHISQSAASAHVRAIEELLRTQLFIRTNKGLELTQAGQLLFHKAKALLNEATHFTSYARELRGEVEGSLVVGSGGDPFSSRIGHIVAELISQHPLIHVNLHSRPSLGTRQGLKTGEIDVGVLLDRPTDASFQYHEITEVYFRVVGPIAWKERIMSADLAVLARLPWVTPDNNSMAYSAVQARLFTDKGLELNSVAHFDNALLARAMAQAGVGMVLMREDQALQCEAEGVLAISPLVRLEYQMFLIHLATRKNDPLIKAFIEAGKKVWPDMKNPVDPSA
jgi:DNA-binding transcriptional LysR family regulator